MEGPTAVPATRQPANIAKIAVKFYSNDPTKLAQMVEFDRNRPLTAFLADRCATWHLPCPEDYALQFSEGPNATYVTEKNRGDIKNGSVLTLCPSAKKNVESIFEFFNFGDASRKLEALKQLSFHSSDISFVQEFINQQGMTLLIKKIETGELENSSFKEVISLILGCFLDLMDHGIVSWDVVDQAFISKITSYVNRSGCEAAVVQSSLTILECLLLNSSKKNLVEKEISWVALIQHLKKQSTQMNVLLYINASFTKAVNDSAREKISQGILSPEVRSVVLSNVVLNAKNSTEIAKQLSVLQSHLMQVVHQQHQIGRFEIETAEKQIAEIRKSTASILAEVPFSSNTTKKTSDEMNEMNRLGFKNLKNPLEDFSNVANSQLVLNCMFYFATKNTEMFRNWILESFSREPAECSFFDSSCEVVKIFFKLFRVDKSPNEPNEPNERNELNEQSVPNELNEPNEPNELSESNEQGGVFDSVIFSSDFPFEEAFCLAMNTLNKTWKEMKATSQDFHKVMGVLNEQVSLSLRNSAPPSTMEMWKMRIRDFNYNKINKIREERRNAKEELESKAEPIVELREMLRPNILSLIGQNRLFHIQKGTKFSHREKTFRFGDKKQFWFCRLSQNKKFLHFGDFDFDENFVIPSAEEMPNVLPVSDIKALLTGKDCPQTKNKKSSSALAFSLVLTGDKKTLDFIAPNEKEFQMWTDALHRLLGEEMTSKLAASDLENLLTWEIKLRLLGTEGIPIPEKTPEFPPPPDNYNFKFHT